MSEEFHVSECSSKSLEEELNRLGSEGWLVVNCWPTDPGCATIVMKREKEFFSKEQGGFQTSRSLSQLSLDVAAARCLRETLSPKAKNHGLRLATLASEFGSEEAQVLDRLRTLGLQTPPKDPKKPWKFIGNIGIAARQDTKNIWWLNAKEFPKKDSAKPAATADHQDDAAQSTKSAAEGKKGSADEVETAPTTTDFSIETAIDLCRKIPPKQEGYAHGILLGSLAKHFVIPVQAVLDGIVAAGVPETRANYTPLHGHKLKLNKNNGQWWLNVR